MLDDDEWLKQLRVGDKVAVNVAKSWEKSRYIIREVTNITPTGRITLSDGGKFDSDGRCKVDKYQSISLEKPTAEILKSIEKRRLVNSIKINELFPLLDIEKLKILLQWQDELIPKKEKEN